MVKYAVNFEQFFVMTRSMKSDSEGRIFSTWKRRVMGGGKTQSDIGVIPY